MKKNITSILFFFLFLNITGVLAQNLEADSLFIKFNNLPNDTAKLTKICHELDKIKSSKATQVIIASNKALVLAEYFKSDKHIAYLNLILGASNMSKSNFEQAVNYLKKGLEFSIKIGNKDFSADANTKLGRCYYNLSEYNLAINSFLKAIEIYRLNNHKLGIGGSYLNIASVYANQSDYFKALEYFTKSLEIFTEINSLKEIASSLNNIGYIHQLLGDYPKAIDYFLRSLSIKEKLNDNYGIAGTLNNIAEIYSLLNENNKALSYYQDALKRREQIGDKFGMGASYGNIGLLHLKNKQYDLAKEYLEKSLKMREEIKDKNGVANSYRNLGNLYLDLKEYQKAIDLFNKAIVINTQIDNKDGICVAKNNLSTTYLELNQYDLAIQNANEALLLAVKIHSKENELRSKLLLSEINERMNKHDISLKYFKEYILLKDSLYNQEKEKQITQKQMNFEFEKKDVLAKAELEKQKAVAKAEIEKSEILLQQNKQKVLLLEQQNELKELVLQKSAVEIKIKEAQAENQKNAISILNKEKSLKELEANQREENLTKQKIISLFAILAVLITSVLLFFAIRNYKQKQKANEIISHQKHQVERQKELVDEKNKEILDSIKYAKRIQTAILPPKRIVKEFLPNSFILYKPKDIVAGDFYWMESKNDLILFAAADCTGHGVPGAMVSVICNNGLNRSVKEFGIIESGKILDKAREIVVNEFEKSDEEVKDGMDISLCILNTKTKQLQWSGANNPLWIVRREIGDNRDETDKQSSQYSNLNTHILIEYKPDKQPIGKYSDEKPFTTHYINLEIGDALYIFTDGFADQFGGDKGKKYKSTKMKELLLSIQNEEMEKQKELIDNSFESWRGNLEQVDDVCVIGVRL